MTNAEKAKSIASGRTIATQYWVQKPLSYEGDMELVEDEIPIAYQCEKVAMDMAKWKDEVWTNRVIEFLLWKFQSDEVIDDFKKEFGIETTFNY